MKCILLTFLLLVVGGAAFGQATTKAYPLTKTTGLQPIRVRLGPAVYEGKKSVMVLDTARGISSELKYARLTDASFHNGTIEVELAGKPSGKAGATARGFVGIAFRIDEQNTAFECIYLRPTNGRAEAQVRRNHSVQYISYPHYP
ncbi:hypothetical protein [Hymenobacter sp. DG01]|uniref:hypothetical protein n=1 Tax=Hymenobacter sp. DG01 TaxID=2584940 RepID=UPI00112059B6|nr:hypothetical protein [Hymenobacter sp. DG01]